MTPTLLMAERAGRPEHTPESESVVVDVLERTIVLELDDGETITFDRAELAAALSGQ